MRGKKLHTLHCCEFMPCYCCPVSQKVQGNDTVFVIYIK